MRRPARVRATARLAVPLVLACGVAAAETLRVTVDGLRSSAGDVLVAVHAGPGTFPSDWSGAVASIRVPAREGSVAVDFDGLADGRYAVIAVHDADGDGAMSKSVLGLPREAFGTSNNPSFWGPPRFRWAVFDKTGGTDVRIRLVHP